MVRKKDVKQSELTKKIEMDNVPSSTDILDNHLELRLSSVPVAFKNFAQIYSATFHFFDSINLPEWFSSIKIGKLTLTGKISKKEKDRIIKMFPNTELSINGEVFNDGVSGWYVAGERNKQSVKDIIDKHKDIWILELDGRFSLNSEKYFELPEELKNVKIKIFSSPFLPNDYNLAKLKQLMPNTDFYIDGKWIYSGYL